MPSQGYPPSYGSLPSYYSHSGGALSTGYPSTAVALGTDSSYMGYQDPHQPSSVAPTMLPPVSSHPAYPTDTQQQQTEGGIFSGSYSTTAMSSPCSSTHSEPGMIAAAPQMESTLSEFVASTAAVRASPAASMSPTAPNQHSPLLETQQSMEVDCLSAEGGHIGELGGDHESTEDNGQDEQSMAGRCVWGSSILCGVCVV
jgi:hypothetical protein